MPDIWSKERRQRELASSPDGLVSRRELSSQIENVRRFVAGLILTVIGFGLASSAGIWFISDRSDDFASNRANIICDRQDAVIDTLQTLLSPTRQALLRVPSNRIALKAQNDLLRQRLISIDKSPCDP